MKNKEFTKKDMLEYTVDVKMDDEDLIISYSTSTSIIKPMEYNYKITDDE